MDNRIGVIVYFITWLVYVAGIHWYGYSKSLRQSKIFFSHAAPSMIAVSIVYAIFLKLTNSVRPLNPYNLAPGNNASSFFVGLFPFLYATTIVTGIVLCILTIVVWVKRTQRRWIPVTILGAGMCAFSFVILLGLISAG